MAAKKKVIPAPKTQIKELQGTILPRLPSILIDMALEDIARVEATSKHYQVDINNVFHDTHWTEGKCTVCFAGAVMACSLGAGTDEAAGERVMDLNEDQIYALDHLRCGEVGEALSYLGITTDRGYTAPEDREVPGYHDDRRGFKTAMRKLSAELKAVGL